MKSILLALGLAVCAVGCRDSIHANDRQRMSDRSGTIRQLESRLRKIDREIDSLGARAAKDSRVARLKERNRYYEPLAQLEKQRTDTRQKFEALRRAPNTTWDQLKSEAEGATERFEQGWRTFVDELNRPEPTK